VDIRVLRRRPVLMTNVAAVFVGFAMFSSFLLVPQLVQTPRHFGYGFGSSVTGAGLLMLPMTFAMLFAGPYAGKLAARSPRLPLILGSAVLAVAFLAETVLHGSKWWIGIAGALCGVGIGFAYAAMANLVVDAVPVEEVGVATGINTIMRSLGGALGAELVASLLAGETIGHSAIPSESAYTDAFLVSGIISLLAVAAALAIPHVRRPSRQLELQPA
jgi:MFS family permease